MATISKKICLIGDFAVGKTSLVRQFVDQQFSDQYLSTVGVKISKKLLTLPEQSNNLQLMIWDIEGQTAFKKIAASYFQGAAGAILVADATRRETLEHISDQARDFLKVNPRAWLVIALNKADLVERSRLIQLASACDLDWCTQVLATYTTSAKEGTSVEQVFHHLGETLLKAPSKPSHP
jgi:small GTP-binding protein